MEEVSWGFIFVGIVFRGYTHLARSVIFNALLLAMRYNTGCSIVSPLSCRQLYPVTLCSMSEIYLATTTTSYAETKEFFGVAIIKMHVTVAIPL